MRSRTAPRISRAHNEGHRSDPVAGLVLPAEIVPQDRLEACPVPHSSNSATNMPKIGLDGPPTVALRSEKF
jgi:hypothetical protein